MTELPVTSPPRRRADAPVPPAATVAHRVQYVAIRAIIAVLRLPGWRAASAFGAWLGRFVRWPVGLRRTIVERHLAAAFPDWDAETVRRTGRDAYESIGRTFIEAAVLAGAPAATIRDLVPELVGWEDFEAAMAAGRGVIVVTGHIGNWELGGAYVAARGLPIAAIYRGMQNPLFDAYLAGTRAALGMETIRDASAVRRVPRALAEGHAVAFLSDQDALGLASTFVPFFGRPARTPRGAGVFALRLDVPVFFAACTRRPDGLYRFSFTEVPVVRTGDREADVDRLVLACNHALEDEIRRVPGQYFWHHRRWKRQPPDTPAHLREP